MSFPLSVEDQVPINIFLHHHQHYLRGLRAFRLTIKRVRSKLATICGE